MKRKKIKTKKINNIEIKKENEKESFIKIKTLKTISYLKLTTQDHYNFFIIYNNNAIQIYEEKDFNLLQSLTFNYYEICFCFIISNNNFIICNKNNIDFQKQ